MTIGRLSSSSVIPGHREAADPESRHKFGASFWIPGSRHSASKTRVNALMRAPRNDEAKDSVRARRRGPATNSIPAAESVAFK